MAEIKPTLTKVFEITDPDILDTWFAECTERGFNNNVSAEAMRFDWLLEQGGKWWGSMENGRIVAVSGAQPNFLDGWRVLFRGCSVKRRVNVKWNPYYTHSHTWYDHLLYQAEYAEGIDGKDVPVYFTSGSPDAGPTSKKFDESLQDAVKVGIIEHVECRKVYEEMQNIWRIITKAICKAYVTRPGLYSLMDVTNNKNVREHVSS